MVRSAKTQLRGQLPKLSWAFHLSIQVKEGRKMKCAFFQGDQNGKIAQNVAQPKFGSKLMHNLHRGKNVGYFHRNLDLEHACWKKRVNFFNWSPPYFVKWREVLLSPVKMFQCSKLPCLGWRSADFLQGFFAQNVCKSSSNMHILVLRFLWLLL
jgi:hypothetical protein